MLIRIAFGSRVGQVVDMLPREARAMLADGRATCAAAVEAPATMSSSPDTPEPTRRRVRR